MINYSFIAHRDFVLFLFSFDVFFFFFLFFFYFFFRKLPMCFINICFAIFFLSDSSSPSPPPSPYRYRRRSPSPHGAPLAVSGAPDGQWELSADGKHEIRYRPGPTEFDLRIEVERRLVAREAKSEHIFYIIVAYLNEKKLNYL
jgi:hypothetical protein